MPNFVKDFISAKDKLFRHFNCPEKYPVHVAIDTEWTIRDEGGIHFLTILKEKQQDAFVIVNREGDPLIFQTNDYTMAIAIDCIKTAFVLRNSNKL